MPSAGILTPVTVTGGGLGDGSSFQPRKDQIEASIVKRGGRIEIHVEVENGVCAKAWHYSPHRSTTQIVCKIGALLNRVARCLKRALTNYRWAPRAGCPPIKGMDNNTKY